MSIDRQSRAIPSLGVRDQDSFHLALLPPSMPHLLIQKVARSPSVSSVCSASRKKEWEEKDMLSLLRRLPRSHSHYFYL